MGVRGRGDGEVFVGGVALVGIVCDHCEGVKLAFSVGTPDRRAQTPL